MTENIATNIAKAFDESTKQINDVQASLLTAAKQSALASIDVYEKSVRTAVDFQEKLVAPTGVNDLVPAQVKLFTDLNTAGVSAARAAFA